MLRRTLITGVLLLGGLAIPAVSQAQSVRVINNAHLSSGKIAKFKAAGSAMINQRVNRAWGSPHLSWTNSSSANQTIEFVNSLNPVNRFCGGGAAGCHDVKNGRPYSIVDTNRFETGRIWSVTGTHELSEMWVDPYIKTFTPAGNTTASFLVEVGDPVEDFSRSSHGVAVTDFATPAWYHNSGGKQDDFNRLPYESGSWFLSCPSGYAWYVQNGTWHEMTPGGCMKRGGTRIGHSLLTASDPMPAPNGMRTNQRGNRPAIFPIKEVR
jgi:hypothetical protein